MAGVDRSAVQTLRPTDPGVRFDFEETWPVVTYSVESTPAEPNRTTLGASGVLVARNVQLSERQAEHKTSERSKLSARKHMATAHQTSLGGNFRIFGGSPSISCSQIFCLRR